MLKVMYLRKDPEASFFGCLYEHRKMALAYGIFAIALLICAGALSPIEVSDQSDIERCRHALLNPSPYELESGYTPTINDACLSDNK